MFLTDAIWIMDICSRQNVLFCSTVGPLLLLTLTQSLYIYVGKDGEEAKSVNTPSWNDAMRDEGTKTAPINQFTPLFANRLNSTGLHFSHMWTSHILPSAQCSIFWGEVRDADRVQALVLEKRAALEYSVHDIFKGAQQVQSRHCENQLF